MIKGFDKLPCYSCMHGEICSLKKNFELIWTASNHSHGITANTSMGQAFDLTSDPNVEVTVACKHYTKVVNVR